MVGWLSTWSTTSVPVSHLTSAHSADWKAPTQPCDNSILAWRIPWTVWSMGSQRVGHDWVTFTLLSHLHHPHPKRNLVHVRCHFLPPQLPLSLSKCSPASCLHVCQFHSHISALTQGVAFSCLLLVLSIMSWKLTHAEAGGRTSLPVCLFLPSDATL